MSFWIAIFILSLVVLIWSADKFTETASKIGNILKIPSFIIGVTIVSIGTSLPELITSIMAVLQPGDATQIVIGNAIGSNVANILLIVGLAVIIAKKISVKRSLIDLDLPLLALSAGLLILVSYSGNISFYEGVLLILGYAVYITYALSAHKKEKVNIEKDVKVDKKSIDTEKEIKSVSFKLILWLVGSGILIYLGAKYTVMSVVELADIIKLAPSIIAISAVAIGTSLPELMVSIQAARRKNYEIAIGNIFGSNIFNSLVIVGIPALIKPLEVPEVIVKVGIPFFAVATLVYIISGITKRLYSYEGAFFLLIYIVFLAKLFNLF